MNQFNTAFQHDQESTQSVTDTHLIQRPPAILQEYQVKKLEHAA